MLSVCTASWGRSDYKLGKIDEAKSAKGGTKSVGDGKGNAAGS